MRPDEDVTIADAASLDKPSRVGMLSRAEVRWLCAIVALAFALRLAWVLTVRPPVGGLVDNAWYYATASNLVHGYGFTVSALPGAGYVPGPGGYQTTFWPPGYSFTLAGVFGVFGTSVDVARGVNVVAGAVAALITFFLGRRMFGPRTGLVASFLFAIHPASIFWSSVLLSEALFTVPFAAAMLLLVLSRRRPTVRVVLSFGLALGCATIIRPQAASVWLVSIIFWWVLFDGRRALRFGAIAAVGLLLWIVPVSIWNSVRTGEPQAVSTNGAFNLRIGHSPDASGRYV